MATVTYRGAEPATVTLPGEGTLSVSPGGVYTVSGANAAKLVESNPRMWEAGGELPATKKNYLEGLPSLKDFGAKGDGVTDDTAAINNAIASLVKEGAAGLNGGALFAPTGVYIHASPINLKELSGVRIIGMGGIAGAAALGVGAGNPATAFLYTGSGARAWDFRGSVGCGLENVATLANGQGFTGFIWDLEGVSTTKTSALAHFVNCTAEAARTSGGAKEIVQASGLNLALANGCKFDHCVFSGCQYGISGRLAASVESVSHRFDNCWFIGNQVCHVVNSDDDWVFTSCVAEGNFSAKGEGPTGIAFHGYAGAEAAAIKSRGVVMLGCWLSSNVAAKRVGTIVEYKGNGLTLQGGEMACGETGVYFPEGALAAKVTGVRMVKLNNGIVIATGKKTVDSMLAFNSYEEVVAALVDVTKDRKGSILQTGSEAALLVS